ncbi:hypothetical protein SAMN05421812_103204 [Asanoa hainanensis]|uniref:DUF4394 domain-containing protein n=1 Tax=Asanoa hainanensis TaxID=560556 RepID=A0A239JYV1_9ACTN|nr:hypothetical protein [Asanoa hainanensis]SNT10970.1 hypothetical protein SAMN05421812_103204 [Asanoa hainanensis]
MRILRTVLAGTAAAAFAVTGSVYVLASPASAAAAATAVGTYTPLAPSRILDTRHGNGAPTGIVTAGKTVHLQVAGRGGVPASGVSAVILNLTVTGSLGNGYLTAYPDGATRPTAASISFAKGVTRANTVTVAVGASGFVNIFQSSLGTHIVADVAGYYNGDAAGPVGSVYLPDGVGPWRLDDTRLGGAPPVPSTGWIQYAITFGDDHPLNEAVTAIAMNLTAVNPASSGYLTTWNGSGEPPVGVSALNYGKGGIWPNSATVPVAPCDFCADPRLPMFGVYTSTNTHWLVDIYGYYFNDTVDGLTFKPITPQRILDTRPGAPIGVGTRTVPAPSTITPETMALSLNVTAVAPTANTYLTVYPENPRPPVSTLNPFKGETVSNGTIAALSTTNDFLIYNNGGQIDVVADMGGLFEYIAPTGTARAKGLPQISGQVGGKLAASTR